MKKILLLNGPNLNLLGTREPDKYGNKTLADIESSLSAYVSEKDAKLSCYQSNHEGDLVAPGIPAMQIYYFGFFMMSLQFAGQSVFVALGKSKNAVFFSIFRKVIIVIPLIILLPHWIHPGVNGIFMAEPISNFIGGLACYGTMFYTLWPELGKDAPT